MLIVTFICFRIVYLLSVMDLLVCCAVTALSVLFFLYVFNVVILVYIGKDASGRPTAAYSALNG